MNQIDIGADAATLRGEGASTPLQIPFGSRGFDAAARRGHDAPSEREIEAAIDRIEDALTGAPRHGGAALRWPGGGALGFGAAAPLPRETVEAWFEHIAARARGGIRQAPPGLPEGLAAAATVLLLREVMHHLDYATLRLDEPG
jgi:hypothetical protein